MLWVIVGCGCFALIVTHHAAEWAERHERVERKIKRHKRVVLALTLTAVLSIPAEVGLHIAAEGQRQQDVNNQIKQGNCILTASDPSTCF